MNHFPDGITWHYVSDHGKMLLDRVKEKPGEIQGIKQSRQRCVYRLVEHGAYVKEIHYNGLRAIVKTFFGGNAAKEGKIALKIRQKGIPVPEVLAFGVKTVNRLLVSDVLITREIFGGKSVHDFLKDDFKSMDFTSKCDGLREFAGFIKKIHDAGIFHRDFHFKNLIIQKHEGKMRFYVLDVDKVSLFSGPLPWKKRLKQLGILFANSWGMCSRNHCLRFIWEYGIDIKQKGIKHLLGRIRQYAADHVYRILDQRSRQSIHANTRFDCKTLNGFRVYYPRKLNDDPRKEKILSHVMNMNKSGDLFLCRRHEEGGLMKLDGNGPLLFVKRYRISGFWQHIKATMGQSVGRQVWKKIWCFPINDIMVPQPLLMIEKDRSSCNKTAFVVFESIEKATPLNGLWPVINEVDKKRLCAKLGIVIGNMHGMGCFHGDLTWENILICRSQGNDDILMTGIDHASLTRRPDRNRAKQDLIPFLTDMDRFCGDEKNRAFFLKCWEKWAGISG